MTTANQGDIVVGVDHSAISAAALRWAVSEAAVSGRQVVALRAWTFEPVYDLGAAVAGTPQAVADRERHQLDEVVGEVRAEHPGVAIRAELVEHSPAVALEEASKTASMLVLGSHGHSRLLKLLVGSVAEHCLHEAGCPVVVIPARTVPEKDATPEPESAVGYYPGPLL
ncbi:universal stress protein [Amycolatopsis vancoresmycina]|uniref:Universal stress protein n=1 Tax=Amycolatopsis vancoresmycina DSM 44592 TaxID=1292037 RepID=R1ICJ5_9PSEU|nr:universal stress protein [Amycolatopsis vancoresmycina]EOD70251.1 universal stress protein [Amycolatopsis vancoresmycina DSM 44592]